MNARAEVLLASVATVRTAASAGQEYAQVQEAARVLSPADERRWLLQFVPLVRRVVRGLSSQVSALMDRSDMEQIGLMGLLEALRRYGEPDDGFGSYAAMRIRGAILDELRRQDWLPRAARQAVHRFRSVERELRLKCGREPSRDEVCRALRINHVEYERLLQDEHAQAFACLDEVLVNMLETAQGPERSVNDSMMVSQALSILTEREREVIEMYYASDFSQAEIAQRLDLTPARICQISKSALVKMRQYLERA